MTKYKMFGSIAVIGILSTAFGAWAKILHLSFATGILTAGLLLQGISLAAFAWFLFEWLGEKKK
jgi:small basic protein